MGQRDRAAKKWGRLLARSRDAPLIAAHGVEDFVGMLRSACFAGGADEDVFFVDFWGHCCFVGISNEFLRLYVWVAPCATRKSLRTG